MFSNNSFLCFCAVIMDKMYNNKELFLTQNSFSEEILQQDFSIDSILDGLVDSDEPAPQNSWAKELKQVVTKEYIKDGQTDPSNCPEVVRKILIVDNEELEKRKESRIPPNTRINTLWAVGSSYLVWINSGVKQNDRNQSQILPNTRINTLWALWVWISRRVKWNDWGGIYTDKFLKQGIYTDKSLI